MNRQIKIVFQPKNRSEFEGKRRFGVGFYSLHKYIGQDNVNTVLRRVCKCTGDKDRIKFRTRGIVDIYFK